MANESTGTKIAIVGGETLLGREVKEVVESRGSVGKLSAFGIEGEETANEKDETNVAFDLLTAKSIASLSAVLLTGSAKAASEAYDLVRAAGGSPRLIDCLGQLESRPEARIVAPLVTEPDVQDHRLLVMAHPAASAMALVVTRLAKYRKLRSAIANVFEPASERGKPGVSELHQQTTALLTFKPLDKTVFDTQVSFNLLPRIGEDAAAQLLATEARIDRHLATLLSREKGGASIPMPSVRLIHAPVFHGYAISVWVEFESDVQAQQIEEALASAQIEIRRHDEEPPDNVGAASQSGLIAGDIRIDRNNPRAAWIWIVMDNLRVVADAAADVVRNLPLRPPAAAAGTKQKS